MNGLNWQPMQLPLAAGLAQKSDDRARSAPSLDIANDVQFDESGGVQTRYPYAAMGSSILGGGTISTARRIVQCGGELLLFDKNTLYTWNAELSKWASKGTHLAVKVDEEPVFVTNGDQIECDRAELDGTIVYAWQDNGTLYVAAVDKSTGSVVLAPTSAGVGTRPRLVALATTILLFSVNGDPQLTVLAIDPDDVSASLQESTTVIVDAPDFNDHYDVMKVAGADQAVGAARRTTTTSYEIFTVTAGLATAQSTKARPCDGPIAVACTPDGATVAVVRGDDDDIEADLITISSLADTAHINKALGQINDTPNLSGQIAAAFRSVADSGNYRCYAFWNGRDPSGLVGWRSEYNYVDTAGNLGTKATFLTQAQVASRAFDHDGRVYVNVVFAGESASFESLAFTVVGALQNTYYLYRDDGFLVAKQVTGRAGGILPTEGHLPGVALTDGTTGYSWCGTERRIIPIGEDTSTTYDDRGPRDITLTFDSDAARRCARLGRTLYIAAGEVLQYDGARLVECGFHVYPWFFAGADNGAGNIPDGSYAYKMTLRWDNARGERDRSTTATVDDVTANRGSNQKIDISFIAALSITHKTANHPALEIWRSAINPTPEAPLFLVTSKDPNDTSGDNCYVANDPTAEALATFTDNFADTSITDNESDPEPGGVLESLAPPAASIIIAGDERLFLAGVPGDPNRVWYSKLRGDGEVASFHDALVIPIPEEGGDITALAFLNETLIVFRETAIYALSGNGFDNVGGGQNYGPGRVISSDVGAVNHESVCFTPAGLVFKSSKGWYLLNRGWSCEYIGAAVTDYDDETPLAVHLIETQHQIRILTTSRMLVFDYLVNQWAEWTIDDGVHACMWNGSHVYVTATGPMKQATAYTDLTYGLDVELSWIKPAELQGASRIRKWVLLGELRSADVTHIRIRSKFDYNDATYVDDTYWPISPTTVGGPMQVKFSLSRQQVQSVKLRFSAVRFVEGEDPSPDEYLYPTGEAVKLTGLAFEVGIRGRLYNRLPAAQRS